jgi:hypothetical protein
VTYITFTARLSVPVNGECSEGTKGNALSTSQKKTLVCGDLKKRAQHAVKECATVCHTVPLRLRNNAIWGSPERALSHASTLFGKSMNESRFDCIRTSCFTPHAALGTPPLHSSCPAATWCLFGAFTVQNLRTLEMGMRPKSQAD